MILSSPRSRREASTSALELLAEGDHIGLGARLVDQHDELLTAPAADDVAAADVVAKGRRHHAKGPVADIVAVGIVEALEVVDVPEQQAGRGLSALELGDHGAQPSLGVTTAADAGERIALRGAAQLAHLSAHHSGGRVLAEGLDGPDDLARGVTECGASNEHRHAVPVGVVEEDLGLARQAIAHARGQRAAAWHRGVPFAVTWFNRWSLQEWPIMASAE